MKIYPYAIEQLAQILEGRLHTRLNLQDKKITISRIITDSRSKEQLDQAVFVAIVTRKNDGHRYIDDMYSRGVRMFLVQDYRVTYPQEDAVYIEVSDTLKALQRWAAYHRSLFPDVEVVGITGSNGKTIVKEWLSYMLSARENVLKSPMSYNSQLGVPLSVLPMDKNIRYAVLEAGISYPGEMKALEPIIRPNKGIFTNIGPAHASNFESQEQKIAEKLELFRQVDCLYYCANHISITKVLESDVRYSSIPVSTWSFLHPIPGARMHVESIQRLSGSNASILSIQYNGKSLSIEIPFNDTVSVENAAQVIFFMLENGFSSEDIQHRIKNLPTVAMRLEIKEGVGNSYLVNDAYNTDVQSLGLALDFLYSRFDNRERCLIVSDVLESGKTESELYSGIASILSNRQLTRIYAIGSALKRNKDFFVHLPVCFYSDTDEFLSSLTVEDFYGKAVLLKGARCFTFERIVKRLEDRIHETVMEVNLSSLVHNLNFFKSLVKPQTKLMVMGKAFSYGSGSYEIADILEYNHVDYVTVAYPDEAVSLRNSGIRLPIMCMNCEESGMETVLRYNIEPVIYNFRTLRHLCDSLDRQSLHKGAVGNSSLTDRYPKVKIHIALDTGMHRMGFEEPDLDRLFGMIDSDPRLEVQSVFTHLATADMPEMDTYTLAQLERYSRMSQLFKDRYPGVIRHCLNTAGIFRFPGYQFDMVRLGIGLYGVGTDEQMQAHLETVSTLKTVISQVRIIQPGEGVGYGRRFIAQRETRVGVIGIGYADGLNRHLGNGRARVWIKGQLAPIIGSICMDMCMVDLTDTDAVENDEVEIFGNNHPVSQLSDLLETIPYEILTSVSQRVKRVYIHE